MTPSRRPRRGTHTAEERLCAIGAAAAEVLRKERYRSARSGEIAARVRLPGQPESGRSAVWLHTEVHSRRVLVSLALAHAWSAHQRAEDDWTPPRDDVPADRCDDTLDAARRSLSAALSRIVRFHRVELFLTEQVGLGLNDIAAAEKTAQGANPRWPDADHYGRVAEAGWDRRCAVYADFLLPRLERVAATVTPSDPVALRASAERLSDLAFHTLLRDDGQANRIADGLAAYWFDRDLTEASGDWVRELLATETTLKTSTERRLPAVDEPRAREALLALLVERGTLHRRAAAVGETGLLAAPPAGTAPSASDRARLAVRTSGAWLGYGHSERARLLLAELPGDELAVPETACALALIDSADGRAVPALEQLRRLGMADVEAAERTRPSIGQRTGASVFVHALRRAGRAVEAVNYARALHELRSASLDHADPALLGSRIDLGRALLSAGHPLEAWREVAEATRLRLHRLPPTGLEAQADLTLLADIDNRVGSAEQAAARLSKAPVTTDWFGAHVSVRLHVEALTVLAKATAKADPAEGLRQAQRCAALASEHELSATDPVARGARRAYASLAIQAGELDRAHEVLEDLRSGEDPRANPQDAVANTIRRAHLLDRLGGRDASAAVAEIERGYAAVEYGLDPTHQSLLWLRLRHARHNIEVANDLKGAMEQLHHLLSRDPVPGLGLPALGEGNPLLDTARALASEIGVSWNS